MVAGLAERAAPGRGNSIGCLAADGDPLALPAPLPDPTPPGIATGPVELGPNLPDSTRNAYQLVNAPGGGFTWDQARVDAMTHTYNGVAGHLVTIESENENWFASLFGSGDRWIGLSDSDAVSTIDGTPIGGFESSGDPVNGWVWVSGQPAAPIPFTNWGGGEPNDSGGEDAAHLRDDARWNDHNAGSTLGPDQSDQLLGSYVIEYPVGEPFDPNAPVAPPPPPPVIRFGPNGTPGQYNAYHEADEDLTWDEARVDSAGRTFMGQTGHLATVQSQEENDAVDAVADGDAWIGLTDSDQTSTIDGATMPGTEGNFAWITGEPVPYTNWGGGEPNDSGSEDAAHIRDNGSWNDDDAGSTLQPPPGSADQDDHRLPHVVEYDVALTMDQLPAWRVQDIRGTATNPDNGNFIDLARNPDGTPTIDEGLIPEPASYLLLALGGLGLLVWRRRTRRA